MWSASFVPHMNHVSVSPTNGDGPTQGQRKTLTRVGIEPTTFGLDHLCSTDKVRREQAVGTEDVKVTAMNMYKYKEGLRFCKRGLGFVGMDRGATLTVLNLSLAFL